MTARHIPTLLLTLLAFALPIVAAEHPVPLEKDADCATCHEDKTKGKAVHSAIAMGCTTCHEVKTEKDVTTVNLVSPKEELCFTCHEKSQDAVRHMPYDQGQCVTCHDPHTSDNPKQLRQAVVQLCFSCHGTNQPGVTVAADTGSVTLPGNQTISLQMYGKAPKLGLDRGGASGHPIMGHPFSGPDPRDKNSQMNCLSCHQPHSSKVQFLMPADVKNDLDLCTRCHQ